MAHTPLTTDPKSPYKLSLRVCLGDDDASDIEMRSADEQKFTIAENVPDFIAPLLVSAPELLTALRHILPWIPAGKVPLECAAALAEGQAAIAKAEGGQSMSTHTPTPWEVEHWSGTGDDNIFIVPKGATEDDLDICDMESGGPPGEARANADFIVLAVNSHADLLKACQAALGVYGTLLILRADKHLPGFTGCVELTRAAIAKATGKETYHVRQNS